MNISAPLAERIVGAINAHDLDALVECFAKSVRNETPTHPARDFDGSDQVRRNWSQIFGAIKDIRAELIRSASSNGFEWLELEFSGHRRDGSPHLMRGVTINHVDNGLVSLVRFYMESVDTGTSGIDQAIHDVVGATKQVESVRS